MFSPFWFIHRQLFVTIDKPTASFTGKTVIVTGSNQGLGLEAARWITQLGATRVILACRNVDKGRTAATSIRNSTQCSPETIDVWALDMSSYASVQAFSERVKTELPRLDCLLANAGIMATKYNVTENNEETITTNIVSSFLLGFLIHPKLAETAHKFNTETHLTFPGSELYKVAKFKERKVPEGKIFATLNSKETANMSDRYNVSKLMTILLVEKMGELAPLGKSGVIINAVCPGFCYSGITREYSGFAVSMFHKMFARETEVGSRLLVDVSSASSASHGHYLPDGKIVTLVGMCKGKEGQELKARLWAELSPKLEGIHEGVTKL
ncbi:putative short-chain dehydrogenase [Periconia macrospinosa]|uniref:Putative short-chain dehydrogenase n=1 Tax=Periconia macrospinosa TaxID=97972 RepID=A0A2V1DI84_9PLEO|nr:putative short-chain dehydrogenase [Periconia macrospinosa]